MGSDFIYGLHTITGHSDSKVVVFRISFMLKLEHDIHIIDFLDGSGLHATVGIKLINRHFRIVHLVRKSIQV